MLGDEIGRGAHGIVYKGLNLENGEFVAIKQVSLENIKDEDLKNIMVRFFFYIYKFTFPLTYLYILYVAININFEYWCSLRFT